MPSTVIKSFSYDSERARLEVTFVSGRRYAYHDLPAHVALAMRQAFAKGEFFNAEIRNRCGCTRLTPSEDNVRKVTE